ncbi:MAG TPA: fumarylacetoacetate hydrolase family protein [Burkholderiaceae bacterium]|nr:fumarylacetoacetate hydrolase family protein [Burkholderiaceae bacterium]
MTTSFVFTPAATAAVPVHGTTAQYPVRRIYCVGRNYVEHAIEMGHSGREAPFFFMKPADAVLPIAEGATGQMHYPSLTASLHHELELVVAIGKGGRNIRAADAMSHVWGYAVGLDMTRRDLQGEAKKLGRPWCIGKGFDESAPISTIRRAEDTAIGPDSAIRLDVNGAKRQASTLGKLIWSVPEIIEHLSTAWDLAPGDLIFTGTPEGVAAVGVGDLLEGSVDGVGSLKVQIVAR